MGNSNRPLRILIVEDHPLTAHGLRTIADETHQVVGVLGRGEEVAQFCTGQPVDLVLLDLALPGKLGSTVLGELLGLPSPPRVLIISMHNEPVLRQELRARGASGFLSKDAPPELLLRAIEAIARGKTWFPGEDEESGKHSLLRPELHLAPRQLEVLRCYAHGLTRKEIAGSLGMSIATVDEHLARLRELLAVPHPRALPAAAFAHGFASPLELPPQETADERPGARKIRPTPRP